MFLASTRRKPHTAGFPVPERGVALEIDIQGLITIVGNYGSGKTEVAVNLAVDRKRAGMEVRVADLDLVNPYFRTREARKQLSKKGIDLALPDAQYLQADLPILSPLISGMIREPAQLTILDVGGDDVGATVLATLADAFNGKQGRMLQVVNPFRPFTDTLEGCLEIRRSIEKASKMRINGLVGNANLIDDTTVEDLYYGYDFLREYAVATGLPLEFFTVGRSLLPDIDPKRFDCPILPLDRQLVPPWKSAQLFND